MLTTLANVKEYLRLNTTDDDTLLTNIINRISADIKRICRRDLEAADYTEKYDGNGEVELLLNQYPINSVASLKVEDSTVDSDDYEIYADSGILKLTGGGIFTKGSQNVEVTYNAGYSTIPEDLGMACIQLVAADYLSSQAAIQTTEGEDIGHREKTLREAATAVLWRYKKVAGC